MTLERDAPILGQRLQAWLNDPVTFCEDQWSSKLWQRQKEMMRAAWTFPRVAVKAGHGVGKSHALARLAIAFLVCHPKSKVVTTAPTWTQVEKILWSELRTAVRQAHIPVGGELLTTELRIEDDWFALGLSTDEVDRLQGFHAPSVLVIFDEASGIPQPLWEAADSLMVGSHSRWVVVGNPLEPSGAFFNCFQPKSGWEGLTVSCEEAPNVVEGREVIPGLVSREWVEMKKAEWGEDSPLYASRVLGQFPTMALSHVIDRAWVRQCQGRYVAPGGRRMVSYDVADMGDDKTAIYVWEGMKIVKATKYGKVEAMQTAGNVVALAEATQADGIVGDSGGLGAPVLQRIRELIGDRYELVGVNGASKSAKEEFRNMRAEVWWTAAQALQEGSACLPEDEELESDLCAPVYSVRNGKILIQDKEEMKRELGRSPDCGDACVLGLWYAAQPTAPRPYVMRETSSQRAIRANLEFAGAAERGQGYGDVEERESDGD